MCKAHEKDEKWESNYFVGKPEGKKSVELSTRTLGCNIKMNFKRKDVLMWTGLCSLRIGSSGLRVPQKTGKIFTR